MYRLYLSLTFLILVHLTFAQFNSYYGNLHSHTDYSGGVGVPLNAFNYANNVANIDVLAVTDHLESIYYSSYEWDSLKISANLSTINGSFVGMAGFEWTSPSINHVNAFNTTGMTSPLNVNNWDAFLTDLQNQQNAIAQFNHPGLLGTNNWNNFAYKTATIDSIFRLIEVKKFSDDSYYQLALNNGWHVSATNNQDNHDWTWGNLDDTRCGIYANTLSYNSIIDALYNRRTFSTMDKNAKVWMTLNGHNMGGFCAKSANSIINIILNDSDNEIWNNVSIISSNNTTLASFSVNHSSVDTTFQINTNNSSWIFIRAKQPDDDYLWSAPIFLTPASSSDEAENNNIHINIFPNPAKEFISIQTEGNDAKINEITIKDITGKKVFQKGYKNETSLNLNTSFLRSGIYFIEINTTIGSFNSRLVIE